MLNILAFKKMHVKTIRYHLISIRIVIFKEAVMTNIDEDVEKGKHFVAGHAN